MKGKYQFKLKGQYKTRCLACGDWIKLGDDITKGKLGWQHSDCRCSICGIPRVAGCNCSISPEHGIFGQYGALANMGNAANAAL